MKIFPAMICCKPERQRLGLACAAGWMVGCLAEHCAGIPNLTERRAFAAQVAHVECLSKAGLQDAFRAEVTSRYEARKKAE
jgi:hypothetical protein